MMRLRIVPSILSTTAKRPHKWEFFHDELGYNYRMPALNAAMGCAQMEKLPGSAWSRSERLQRAMRLRLRGLQQDLRFLRGA